MPEVTARYNLVMKLRRFSWVYRPLKWTHRLVTETIPAILLDLVRVLAPTRSLRLGPPTGSFSICSSLVYQGRRPGRMVLTDQGAPDIKPDSLQLIAGLHSHASQPWPVFWSHHKRARLVASSLAFMDERKQICREAVYGDVCLKDDPAWNYFLLPKPLWLEGNWTSLVSRWTPNDIVPPFTHWILDALPRLAMLSEFPSDTRILVPARLAGYQKETLALLGLTERCRQTPERHIVVENYYFASPTAMIDCYNPFGVDFLRSQFLPKADPSYVGPKKFVIRRSSNTRRGILNEEELYQFFTDLGWGILETEKLTFAQEIKLFNEAEAVTGIFGSGFTNAVWCRKGCKLLPFVPDNWLDGYVEWIAGTLGLEFHYRIFPSDHAMRARIDLTTVKEMLRAAGLHP